MMKLFLYMFFSLSLLMFPQKGETTIKAIIFDCDGVLVDSEKLKFQAWQEVLETRGIFLTEEEYRPWVGHTGLYLLQKLCEKYPQLNFDPKIVDEKNLLISQMQQQNVTPLHIMTPIVNWAIEQKKQGKFQLAVASSAPKTEIFCNLKSLNIDSHLDVILCGKEDLKHYNDPEGVNKPKPYIYQEAAALLNLKPHECLVFEDSEAGVTAAKLAGCYVIAKPTSWTKDQNFELADAILDDSHIPTIAYINQFIDKYAD